MTQIELAGTIAAMDNETQNAFYRILSEKGFTEEEIFAIHAVVFSVKLFENDYFYKAVEQGIAKQVYAEFNK